MPINEKKKNFFKEAVKAACDFKGSLSVFAPVGITATGQKHSFCASTGLPPPHVGPVQSAPNMAGSLARGALQFLQ